MKARLKAGFRRRSLAARKAGWRLFNNHAPDARAVYILGAQRSGTTLLLDCLEKSMQFQVFGEASDAMVDFRIRDDETIRQIVRASHHKFVVFKPLTDSHRACDFLKLIPDSTGIWAFRRVEDRANSAVAKFGDHNLQILREFSEGRGLDRWQAQGLTDETVEFIGRFDYSNMLPETAAAIFWYIRNSLYFSNGLDKLPNVLPLAYEDLVSEPKRTMQGVCRFVGGAFEQRMICDVHASSIGRRESRVADEVLALCGPMYDRLHDLQRRRWKELRLEGGS